MPSRFASSNSSCPCVVWSTGISSKLSRETIVTSAAPPRRAARAESSASFIRASVSPASSEGLLLASQAQRGAGGVEGHEAAPDHDHPAAEVHPVAAVDVEEVVDGLHDAVELDARGLQVAALRDADREEDRLEAGRAARRGRRTR
jgi:hypothetical protein